MNVTPIEWTNFSANPLKYRNADGKIVWGCVHASKGCLKCYSEALAKRYGRGGPFNAATMAGLTPFLDEKELRSMLTHKPASGKMCFVGDMTDIFGEWVPFELLDKLFAVFALRPDVTWQILTKRPERILKYLSPQEIFFPTFERIKKLVPAIYLKWPLPNVWLGTSAENQETADRRIPELLQTPAAVRFVSYEPALGPVDFTRLGGGTLDALSGHDFESIGDFADSGDLGKTQHPPGLDWLIVGGESGPGARPFDVKWLRDAAYQCRTAKVPLFVKQMGSVPIMPGCRQNHWDWGGAWGHTPRFENYSESPAMWRIRLKSKKGGDMAEWPTELRVREFPIAALR